jgi:acyl dehydratase
MFIRGEGGWGGDRGPSGPKNVAPDRAPDHEVTYVTRPDQALTYRLSGDRNPLHADPEFAKAAGFPKPILHGLCTYGFTGRALLHSLCGSDPARFTSMAARFSKPVYPGDALTVKMWVDGGEAIFRTETQNGDVVIDQGLATFTP